MCFLWICHHGIFELSMSWRFDKNSSTIHLSTNSFKLHLVDIPRKFCNFCIVSSYCQKLCQHLVNLQNLTAMKQFWYTYKRTNVHKQLIKSLRLNKCPIAYFFKLNIDEWRKFSHCPCLSNRIERTNAWNEMTLC